MPELPEVETVKNYLNDSIKNKKIKDVLILHSNIVCGKNDFFKKSLIKRKILEIKRRGKYLIFILDKKYVIFVHLRMEGKFIFNKNKNKFSKHSRVIFFFENGSMLIYDDSRAFGKMYIENKKNYLSSTILKKLGPEAIEDINIDNFYNSIHSKRKCIKNILLDQSIISGIGNIYATEILFKSKISPLTKVNKLSKKELSNILKNSKNILLLAIKYHGCTSHSFTYANNKKGGFQNFLQIYGKNNKKCPICKKKLIKIKINGRGTVYCKKCQK